MSLNILNHVSNEISGANISISEVVNQLVVRLFTLGLKYKIRYDIQVQRAILTQVETKLNLPDTFRSRPVNINTVLNQFNVFSAKHEVEQHSNHGCALFTTFLSILNNTKSRTPVTEK